jgi:hypothetical protein
LRIVEFEDGLELDELERLVADEVDRDDDE